MSSNQQQSNESSSMDIMWMIIFLIIAVVAIWFYGREPIIRFLLLIKSYELGLIGVFTNQLAGLDDLINVYASAPGNVSISALNSVLINIGRYLAYPVAGLLTLLAMYVYFANPTLKFNIRFDMKRLLETEKEFWPQIIPVAKANLHEKPLNDGPWSVALSPMEFAHHHNLLKAPERKVKRNRNRDQATIITNKAREVFIQQLGSPWLGVKHIPIHVQALFGVFAARAKEDRDEARALLARISRSSQTGKLDFTGAKSLAMRYKDDELIKLVVGNHAYVLTVMATMLELARTDGVLATADFLWLKPVDRKLWYMLNSVGRQTVPPEVAGPFSHWLAERELQRKMEQPLVEQAVEGLSQAINELIYVPADSIENPLLQ